jgi:CBS domain-containing protein
VSNPAELIAGQIEKAGSVAELQRAAARVDEQVAQLHAGGAAIERIAGFVGELNTRLFARLWSLLAPPELVANSCLIVMGSEGRREQILKTDQDNGLLLRDGFECAGLAELALRFNAALGELGYPPCPGHIMLSNPLWRQPLARFRESLRDWIYAADREGPLRLAIFFDAAAVAGDAGLLVEAREHLEAIVSDDDAFLARFAHAADQFDEPGGWWTRLTAAQRDARAIDLKKLGTFPIVHGVRALALQYRVRAVGTAQRLGLLVEQQHLDATMARQLVDALHVLMKLKLSHQLRQRERGEPASNVVRPGELDPSERAPLAESLAVIKRFRVFLREHFRLDWL